MAHWFCQAQSTTPTRASGRKTVSSAISTMLGEDAGEDEELEDAAEAEPTAAAIAVPASLVNRRVAPPVGRAPRGHLRLSRPAAASYGHPVTRLASRRASSSSWRMIAAASRSTRSRYLSRWVRDGGPPERPRGIGPRRDSARWLDSRSSRIVKGRPSSSAVALAHVVAASAMGPCAPEASSGNPTTSSAIPCSATTLANVRASSAGAREAARLTVASGRAENPSASAIGEPDPTLPEVDAQDPAAHGAADRLWCREVEGHAVGARRDLGDPVGPDVDVDVAEVVEARPRVGEREALDRRKQRLLVDAADLGRRDRYRVDDGRPDDRGLADVGRDGARLGSPSHRSRSPRGGPRRGPGSARHRRPAPSLRRSPRGRTSSPAVPTSDSSSTEYSGSSIARVSWKRVISAGMPTRAATCRSSSAMSAAVSAASAALHVVRADLRQLVARAAGGRLDVRHLQEAAVRALRHLGDRVVADVALRPSLDRLDIDRAGRGDDRERELDRRVGQRDRGDGPELDPVLGRDDRPLHDADRAAGVEVRESNACRWP